MNHAEFSIIDTGHTNTRTVTNDPEFVIETLTTDRALGDRRVFYSEGQIDKLKHTGGKFTDFAPGHAGVIL